jgi:hypothetical protein
MEKLFDWADTTFAETDLDGPVFFALGAARAAAAGIQHAERRVLVMSRLKDIESAFLRAQLLWEGRK